MKDKKGMGSERRGDREKLWGVAGENIRMYFMKKTIFNKKKTH